MKRTHCIICKERTEKPFRTPIIGKQQYLICSKECYKEYVEIWRSEKPIPKVEIKVTQEIEEFPDY